MWGDVGRYTEAWPASSTRRRCRREISGDVVNPDAYPNPNPNPNPIPTLTLTCSTRRSAVVASGTR